MPTRRPRNQAEATLFDLMTSHGWTPSKRGWPDFICYKDNRVLVIEVKPHRGRRLKREQLRIMQHLAAHGIDCYRWNPDTGFEPILGNTQPKL